MQSDHISLYHYKCPKRKKGQPLPSFIELNVLTGDDILASDLMSKDFLDEDEQEGFTDSLEDGNRELTLFSCSGCHIEVLLEEAA